MMTLKDITIYPIGIAKSCCWASHFLTESGFQVTDHITPEITHLLLDIPSFDSNGNLKDGTDLQELLRRLPSTITIIGGNLKHPYLSRYNKIDLLHDAVYQAKNAAITAECALQAAAPYLDRTFADAPVLILGWGRIGKCLSALLKAMGCSVTVAARKEDDRGILKALGYGTITFDDIAGRLHHYKLLFNTVPQQTVPPDILNQAKDCVKVDLASAPGMVCDDVIIARGLPGKYAPKTSGKLIAESIQTVL